MPDPTVQAVRAFNRFYTRRIGALAEGHLNSPFSLTEVRVLYELAHRRDPSAAEIARDLGLDAGYLSRILLRFQKRRLIARRASPGDARRQRLILTRTGRQSFALLDRAASAEVSKMLRPLSRSQRQRMAAAMRTIEALLRPAADPRPEPVLRPHRPGDMGWVVHRHGALYFQEYGWDERFEALVAGIVAQFVRNFDSRRERCWIAKSGGVPLGSIFLVRQSDEVAKLRLLLVEPEARGLGLGKRLVAECIAFARECGYRTITLWTQDILHAARHIYQQAGFRLVRAERNLQFGVEMTSEIWELAL